MKTFEINSHYSSLKDFIVMLPVTFSTQGELIHGNRNLIKRISIPEGEFIVKNFKGMYFLNRLALTLLRISKSELSYKHAEILKENGILTPPNVGWIDRYSRGLLMESFYVSAYRDWQSINQVLKNTFSGNLLAKDMLIKRLASFAFKLHQLGIYHNDFSVGNILVVPPLETYTFALVDLNRMQFGEVQYFARLRNFSRLDLTEAELNLLLSEYARLSGQSAEASILSFWKYKHRVSALRRARKNLKKYTLGVFKK
jgi:tRNA A-37 threonylcarbamoyl transferase component Bud32